MLPFFSQDFVAPDSIAYELRLGKSWGVFGRGGSCNNGCVLKPDVAIASEVSISSKNSLAITDFLAKRTQLVNYYETKTLLEPPICDSQSALDKAKCCPCSSEYLWHPARSYLFRFQIRKMLSILFKNWSKIDKIKLGAKNSVPRIPLSKMDSIVTCLLTKYKEPNCKEEPFFVVGLHLPCLIPKIEESNRVPWKSWGQLAQLMVTKPEQWQEITISVPRGSGASQELEQNSNTAKSHKFHTSGVCLWEDKNSGTEIGHNGQNVNFRNSRP